MANLVHDAGRWFAFWATLFIVDLGASRAGARPRRKTQCACGSAVFNLQAPLTLQRHTHTCTRAPECRRVAAHHPLMPPPPRPASLAAFGALLRLFAYILPDMETAQTAPGPVLAIQVVFAGFLIAAGKMGWCVVRDVTHRCVWRASFRRATATGRRLSH